MIEGVRTSRSTDEAKDATNKKTSGRTWTKYRLARCMKGSQKGEQKSEPSEQEGDRAKKGNVDGRANV